MSMPVVTVSVTEFKAKCVSLFNDLEGHKISKIIVTRRGRPVAELKPPARELPSLYGAHAGSVEIAGDYDLTRPTFADETFDAETGVLHR